MVRFEANTLYAIKELEGMLGDMVAVETFLRRLNIKRERRMFRDAIWGNEILEAVKEACKDLNARLDPNQPVTAKQPPKVRPLDSRKKQPRVRPFSANDL